MKLLSSSSSERFSLPGFLSKLFFILIFLPAPPCLSPSSFSFSPSFSFPSPSVAYEAVEYCVVNQRLLCHSTSVLTQYFPNLLKVFVCPCVCQS